MKSDRRTLVSLLVLICFITLSFQFRSYFAFGARILLGKTTIGGIAYGDTTDEQHPKNVGIWTVALPSESGTSREEKLGHIISTMLKNWNQAEDEREDAIKPLEEYCSQNATDLPARAHLLRLAMNLSSIEKARDKDRLKNQATRLSKIADDSSVKEPNNWYWRDRQFHLLIIQGKDKEAISILTAKPLPDSYNDYVSDEAKCKEALYRGKYHALPDCAVYSLWAEILFPHFSSFSHIEKLAKANPNNLEIRAAQMSFGQSMVKSGSNSVTTMVGLRNIRQGLYNSNKIGPGFKVSEDLSEKAKMEIPFQKVSSIANWNQCLKLVKEDVFPRFMRLDQDPTNLYYGQFGPVMTVTGILCLIAGIGSLIFTKISKKALSNQPIGWIVLLIAFAIQGLAWNAWQFFGFRSFGNSKFLIIVIMLSVWAIVQTLRREDKQKWIKCAVLVIALGFGITTQYWQASMIIFLLIYIIQKGEQSLKPWTVALLIATISYHTCLNLSFSHAVLGISIATLASICTVIGLSDRNLQPDQPRLAPLTTGLAAILIGMFLTAQYDQGMVKNLQEETQQASKLHDHLMNL